MLDALGDLIEDPAADSGAPRWSRLPFLGGKEVKELLAESYGELAVAAADLPWAAALLAAAQALPAGAWASGVALCAAGAELTVTQARARGRE